MLVALAAVICLSVFAADEGSTCNTSLRLQQVALCCRYDSANLHGAVTGLQV